MRLGESQRSNRIVASHVNSKHDSTRPNRCGIIVQFVCSFVGMYMLISIEVPKSIEAKLVEEAARQGMSVETYAAELLQQVVEGQRSFAEILAPFRTQVSESGMDDASLDGILESARNAAQDDRR